MSPAAPLMLVSPDTPAAEGEISLVRAERDLLTQTRFDLSAEDLAAIRERSHAITDAVGSALPRSLRTRFWPAFAEAFRMYSVAPQVANEFLTRHLLDETGASKLHVRERITRDWWSLQGTIAEAVLQTARSKVRVTLEPGLGMRLARAVVADAASLVNGLARIGRQIAEGLHTSAPRSSARRIRPTPGSVLFLAMGPTTITLATKLRTALADSHGISSALIGLEPGDVPRALEQFGGPVLAPGDFTTPSGAARAVLAWLASRFSFAWWLVSALSSGAVRALRPYAYRALARRLMIALAQELPCVVLDWARAEALLDRLRPAAVVSFHLYAHGMSPYVLAARARGIPVIYVQHGVYLAKDDCVEPLDYDLHLVFGPAAAERFAARPAPTRVVGHPLCAATATNCPLPEPIATLRTDDRPLLLAATQPPLPEDAGGPPPAAWLRPVAEAAAGLNARLLIKPHPAETDLSLHESLVREFPASVTLLPPGTATIPELLRVAEVLLTRDSTAVFEAAAADVPAVTINLTGQRDRFPFAADGGAVGVYRADDLQPALAHILSDPAHRADLATRRQAFIARHLGGLDGDPIAHIAEAIAGLLA